MLQQALKMANNIAALPSKLYTRNSAVESGYAHTRASNFMALSLMQKMETVE